jgi:gluconolactonase
MLRYPMNNLRSLVLGVLIGSALASSAGAQSVPVALPPGGTPSAGPGRGQFRAPAPDTTLGLPPTISAGAQVEKLAVLPTEPYTVDGKPFTEGATCAPNGDVYFIEQNSSKILRWNVADRKLSVFMHPSGYANGMCFDYQGNLIACADERNELWSISIKDTETVPYPLPLNPAVGDPARPAQITVPTHTVLVKGYQGKLLGGPNDVWVRPDGGMYLTDPFYARKWWAPGRQQEQDMRTVYFLSPDHKTLTRVIDVFDSPNGRNGTPNGIAGTPDGKTLYVSDISGGQTWAFAIHEDGSLTDKRLVCRFGSDGMTLDDQGNLYMSVGGGRPGGVTVVDTKTGKQIGYIPMPESPANMCFGGSDRQTLYITARTGFYCIATNVKGANPGK